MPTAGDIITVPTVPGSRIATEVLTTDSTSSASPVVAMSVTAAVVEGRIYRVRFAGLVSSTVMTDSVVLQIREDDEGGPLLATTVVPLTGYNSTFGYPLVREVEWTASATGSQTFAAVTSRFSGTGSAFVEAASNRPAYFYVDYIRDARRVMPIYRDIYDGPPR